MTRFFLAPLIGWARKLRFPWLVALTAALFTVTLIVPDPLPFVDEVLLALGTLMFASLKRKKRDSASASDTSTRTDETQGDR